MPLVIPNTTTGDDYGPADFGGQDVLAGGYVVVANNPVGAKLLYGPGQGQTRDGPESYLPPGTYPILAGARDPVSGVKFRSWLPGEPAQVFGLIYYAGEPSFGSGQPYTQNVTPSGVVSATGVTLAGVAASTALTLGAAEAVVPGCSFGLTVVGSSALILMTAEVEVDVTGPAAGSTYVGRLYIDATAIGGRVVYEDTGGGNQRLSLHCQGVIPSAFAFPGTHTLELRGIRTAGAGVCDFALQTNLAALLVDR